MGNKEKGANAERELLHMFYEKGWMAIRAAGSGKLPEPSCDLLVGRGKKKFAIECKTCKTSKRYIDKKQIENFKLFSKIFGLKPFIAVRFSRSGWFFVPPECLEETGKGLAIDLEKAKRKGKTFFEFIK